MSAAVRTGYKKTELGVIPRDWVVRPLGELTSTVASGRSKVGSTYGAYSVHGSTGVIGSCEEPEYEGDAVLVARVGANAGRLNIVSGRYGVTDNTIIVRVRNTSHLPFFWRQLEGKNLNNLVFGSGQPLLTGSQLKALNVCEPPLPEQRAIATALSDVDALLAKLDALIAKKRDLKVATMQQLLTGQTRLPGFSGEWEVRRLGDMANLYQPATISAKQFTASGYPVYGANGVVGFFGEFNHESPQVTVTCRGSTCGTVNRTVARSWITGNAMVVNCDQSSGLNKDFLYYLLLNQDLSICITGSGQPQIVRGPLANFELPLPSDPIEQIAIATVLSDMDAELTALEARRDKTRALKQGMMQELLTGRIRLVVSGD